MNQIGLQRVTHFRPPPARARARATPSENSVACPFMRGYPFFRAVPFLFFLSLLARPRGQVTRVLIDNTGP